MVIEYLAKNKAGIRQNARLSLAPANAAGVACFNF